MHIVTRTGTLRKSSSAETPPAGEENIALGIPQVAGLDLTQTSLVVLSGRQSGNETAVLSHYGWRVPAKAATVGALSQAFLYAGAQSVIAALWDVDDKATKTVMLSFYSNLREGMSKEEALRTAQLEIRKKYPQPYYWAGFVLTGVSSN